MPHVLLVPEQKAGEASCPALLPGLPGSSNKSSLGDERASSGQSVTEPVSMPTGTNTFQSLSSGVSRAVQSKLVCSLHHKHVVFQALLSFQDGRRGQLSNM